MINFLARRILAAILTIWVTTIAVSMLIHLVPGDPVQIMYAQSQGTTPEQLEAAAYASTGPVSILLGWLPILAFIIFGVWPSQKHDNRWGAYVPPAAKAEPGHRDPASIKSGDE